MAEAWVILTGRYGADTRNPTVAQLADAVKELYHEAIPGMTADFYAEHGAAFLRYGHDDGPMFVLEISRLGEITFEEWADQDYECELRSPRSLQPVSEERALSLWTSLAMGDIDKVRSQFADS